MIEKICPVCDKEFKTYPSINSITCSQTCSIEKRYKQNFEERFWSKVEKTDSCWLWKGAIGKKGYGRLTLTRTKGIHQYPLAHRIAFILVKGNIPEKLTIDHLCRNRACVNPDHLEIVTVKENVLRGIGLSAENARKTHCLRGHPLDGKNLMIYREKRGCKACKRKMERRRYAQLKSIIKGEING